MLLRLLGQCIQPYMTLHLIICPDTCDGPLATVPRDYVSVLYPSYEGKHYATGKALPDGVSKITFLLVGWYR